LPADPGNPFIRSLAVRLDRFALTVGALIVASSARSSGQSADVRKGIEQANQEFIAAMKTAKAGKFPALLTNNAVIVTEYGNRFEASAATISDFKQLFDNVRITAMANHISDFGSSGNTAWAAGTETATFVDKKTGKQTPGAVQYLAVYERQATGKYLLRYWVETKMPPKKGA
jgi:ketosteroid isomerase-like protein